jgi:ABC-type uncharacterized transport system substrate-binding protein
MIPRIELILLTLLPALAFAPRAGAHPHVWVTFHTELVYGPDGSLTGIRHDWTFDDMYAASATEGIKSKQKGTFTRDELAPLAEVNITSLKRYGYFTFVKVDGKKVELADPLKGGYWLSFKDSMLALHFTLPLKYRTKAHDVAVDVYDPAVYVDFEFDKKDPAALDGAPASCQLVTALPRALSEVEVKALREIPADQVNTSMVFGEARANKIRVTCP